MKNKNEMKSRNSLSYSCVYFGEDKSDAESLSEKFVGLKCTDGKLKIYFPVGYRKPDEKNNSPAEIEKEVRRNILNLIQILRRFGEKEDNLSALPLPVKNQKVDFPIHAYLFIIRDFLSNGYYVQKETLYSKSPGGKVSWNRTIKSVKPQFLDFQPFYFDFITQQINYSKYIYKLISFEKFIELLEKDIIETHIELRISRSGDEKGRQRNKNIVFQINTR